MSSLLGWGQWESQEQQQHRTHKVFRACCGLNHLNVLHPRQRNNIVSLTVFHISLQLELISSPLCLHIFLDTVIHFGKTRARNCPIWSKFLPQCVFVLHWRWVALFAAAGKLAELTTSFRQSQKWLRQRRRACLASTSTPEVGAHGFTVRAGIQCPALRTLQPCGCLFIQEVDLGDEK